jgi:hypothetical protein
LILVATAIPAILPLDPSASFTENLGIAVPILLGTSFFLITFVLWLGVVLLNRPKFAVPPYLRQEAGVLSAMKGDLRRSHR